MIFRSEPLECVREKEREEEGGGGENEMEGGEMISASGLG